MMNPASEQLGVEPLPKSGAARVSIIERVEPFLHFVLVLDERPESVLLDLPRPLIQQLITR